MNSKTKSAFIRCDDNQELLVFDRTVWRDGDELLAFSIMDSYVHQSQNHGIWGRVRRAWCVLFAKPIYYAEIVTTQKERVQTFLNECSDILSDTGGR